MMNQERKPPEDLVVVEKRLEFLPMKKTWPSGSPELSLTLVGELSLSLSLSLKGGGCKLRIRNRIFFLMHYFRAAFFRKRNVMCLYIDMERGMHTYI